MTLTKKVIDKKAMDLVIKALRDELEYVDQHGDSQWVMAVSMKKIDNQTYLSRVVVKTSHSPYVDGTEIKVSIIDGKVEVDLSFIDETPIIQGAELDASIRWIEGLNSFCFIQGNDPFYNEGITKENKKLEGQIATNSHQEELYLRILRYELDEYSFRNLGEFNCFDSHIRNIENLYKGLLIDTLLVEDIVVDGVEVSPGEYKLQILIDDNKYILEPSSSFTKEDVLQEIKTKIIQSIVKVMKK